MGKHQTMKKLIFVLVAVFLFASGIEAKSGNGSNDYNSKIYWKAKLTFTEANYKESLLLFTYLLDQNPDDTELNAYVGLCYKYLYKEKVANFYLEKVKSDHSMFIRLILEDMRSSRNSAFQ